jgi:hypothetical protein
MPHAKYVAEPENKAGLFQEYFSTGLHYHISARFAAFAWLLTCGNLAHHAVERYLKGYLCREMDEVERKKLGHNLRKIWTLFKKEVGDSSLNRFDAAISAIDKFEDIRYPEKIMRTGMTATIGLKRGGVSVQDKTSSQKPNLDFVIDELDELAKVIFEKANVNPTFFTNGLNEDARRYLTDSNNAATWWTGAIERSA